MDTERVSETDRERERERERDRDGKRGHTYDHFSTHLPQSQSTPNNLHKNPYYNPKTMPLPNTHKQIRNTTPDTTTEHHALVACICGGKALAISEKQLENPQRMVGDNPSNLKAALPDSGTHSRFVCGFTAS